MNKFVEAAKETLVLDEDEEIVRAFKALFFPTAKSLKQFPKLRWGKEYKIEEKRKDVNVNDGILALTNKRIFWLHQRGTFKKTFHPTFFISIENIASMNMQGRFAKRINIVSSEAEFQFRFGRMEEFIELVSKLRNDLKAKAPSQVAGTPTPLEDLKKLKELLDIGAITQEEYEEKKKKILEKV